MEKKELFEKKIQSFEEWWIRIMGHEPKEKLMWFFKKGMEKQIEVRENGEPPMAGERYFIDAALLDDEHYPTREEFKDCQRAFCQGFYTDMRVYYA